jgi:very-short-patch-repair endonuclease
MPLPQITSNHKALTTYYTTLSDLRGQQIQNEGGLRRAFAALLATLGKTEVWTLAEEQTLPSRIRPDGVLLDEFRFPRGYWEAKDSADDLEAHLPSPSGKGVGGEGEPPLKKSPLPPELLQRCRDLRQRATNAEQMLWQLLRDRQIAGKKFRRQHPLRGYILDFYCHEARLVIELDGSGHSEPTQATYDAKRTQVLQAEGMSVLRFWNNQVFENIEGVLEAIWMALTRPSPKGRGSKIVNSPRPLGEGPGVRENQPGVRENQPSSGVSLRQARNWPNCI